MVRAAALQQKGCKYDSLLSFFRVRFSSSPDVWLQIVTGSVWECECFFFSFHGGSAMNWRCVQGVTLMTAGVNTPPDPLDPDCSRKLV